MCNMTATKADRQRMGTMYVSCSLGENVNCKRAEAPDAETGLADAASPDHLHRTSFGRCSRAVVSWYLMAQWNLSLCTTSRTIWRWCDGERACMHLQGLGLRCIQTLNAAAD